MRIRNPNLEQGANSFKSLSKNPDDGLGPTSAEKKLDHPVPQILIVDDEEGIRQLLKQLLIESGYVVRTCTQASEALEDRLQYMAAYGSPGRFESTPGKGVRYRRQVRLQTKSILCAG